MAIYTTEDFVFQPGSFYQALFRLAEKPGYALTGVSADTFTHSSPFVTSISNSPNATPVTVDFAPMP